MRTLLISYDLAKPDLNETYIVEAIMNLGQSWARPLETVWYLRTEQSQSAIEARLSRLLDDNDGLLVQPVREEAVFCNTGLRWFRRRRQAAPGNVVPFPAADAHYAEPAYEPLRAAI